MTKREPVWWSLCCGLDAAACLAMTSGRRANGDRVGMFAPVSRMGGKRAYAEHVLEILGIWPTEWAMIDADPAIVEFWQAAFGGCLPVVAEIIRAAPCDGEELWKLWTSEPVPSHPLERVARWQVVQAAINSAVPISADGDRWVRGGKMTIAGSRWKYGDDPSRTGRLNREVLAARNERLARWIVAQKGNFSGKPVSWGEGWGGIAGYSAGGPQSPAAVAAGWGFTRRLSKEGVATCLESFWEGLAGYGSVSDAARRIGFKDRFTAAGTSEGLDGFHPGPGSALLLDLDASSPVFLPEDLVTIDPPYVGTTGYGANLPRERVVELAEEAHACGCRVLVHETEPVITGGPWRHVELERRTRKNADTWRAGDGKRRREVATTNFAPARTVSAAMAPVRTAGGFDGPLFE